MRFINREKELRFLEEQYKKPESNFVVIYGRRRTGKTALIREFIKDKLAIYFLADIQTETEQLLDFQESAANFFQTTNFLKIKLLRHGMIFFGI